MIPVVERRRPGTAAPAEDSSREIRCPHCGSLLAKLEDGVLSARNGRDLLVVEGRDYRVTLQCGWRGHDGRVVVSNVRAK